MCMTTALTTGKVARCCFYSQNRTEEERVVSVHIWKTQPSSQRACAIGDLRLSILIECVLKHNCVKTQLSIQPVFYKYMENSLPLTQRFILQFMKFHSVSSVSRH